MRTVAHQMVTMQHTRSSINCSPVASVAVLMCQCPMLPYRASIGELLLLEQLSAALNQAVCCAQKHEYIVLSYLAVPLESSDWHKLLG